MKTLLQLAVISLFFSNTFAQIPNPGFEAWPALQPSGWRAYWTSPFSIVEPDHPDSNSHSGFLAVKSEIFNILQCTPSGLFTGSELDSFYIPISVKPYELHGWYVLNSISNDKFMATVKFKKNGQVIGYGQFVDSVSSAVYQEFVAYISYNAPSIPDSFSIALTFNDENPFSLGTPGAGNCGSHFIVDDLSFQNTNSIQEINNSGFIKIFPNPGTNTLMLKTSSKKFSVIMYDIVGNQIISSKNENQIDVSKLTAGVYVVEIKCGEKVYRQKFLKE